MSNKQHGPFMSTRVGEELCDVDVTARGRPSSRARRRGRWPITGVATSTAVLCWAAASAPFGAAASATPKPSQTASATSLTVMPSPDGPWIDDFNPFDNSSGAIANGSSSMIYEPLLMFNDLKANSITPWLAKSYAFSNRGKTLTFHLHPGVKWSDGAPFTSADVAFTFEMLKKHPSINGNGITPTSITTPNSMTVTLNFASPQFVNLINIAQTPMVPEHIWRTVNPVTYTDSKPVGTGPYTLKSFSPQSYTLVANPDYWQKGLPKVRTLVYPGYNSNTAALAVFSSMDWSSLFEPDIQKLYVAPGHGQHHYWFPPVSAVALVPNLKNYPVDIPDVRKAISDAINRKTIDTDGEDGYEPPVTNLAGVIPGQSSYLDKSIPGLAPKYAPSQAKKLLAAAGLKKGRNGYYESASGKPINLNLVVPSAFTDWTADAGVIADELKAVGLDTTVDATAVNAWVSDGATGKFDLTLNGSDAGPSPYYMYNAWLNSSFTAPEGKSAISNWERYNSPKADGLLAEFASTNNVATQRKAMYGLETIMANDLPFIPLVYNVAWDEYSTAKVTGWPDAAHPYMVPAGYDKPGDELIMLHLKPKS